MKFQLLNPRPIVRLPDTLPFGRTKTHHMVIAEFRQGRWSEPAVVPLDTFGFNPGSVVFHYGQQIFEGMKAYRGADGEAYLFRPDANARRFRLSAERLAMQPVPEEMFIECVRELVNVEREWIPAAPGALYIRPFLIPLDEGVSYRASQDYRFCVIVSPVDAYFTSQSRRGGITVLVERELSRAAPGGVGSVKCGGNYASALYSVQRARAGGATDVIWLDAAEHRYVEEVGTMNLFFFDGARLMTPELTGSILPGITRDSLIKLGNHLGMQVEECRIDIDRTLEQIRAGQMREVFGCGTAVVVCPIETILDRGNEYQLANGPDPVAMRLRELLYSIQSGRAEDPFGWRVKI
jgi:branched-chain amino acid aminotransferase